MKKSRKKMLILTSIFSIMLFLSGCARQTSGSHLKPPTGFFYGSIYRYFAVPMQHIMEWIANIIGGTNAYGWAIILITLVVRLILLPLMLNQSKNMTTQQEKMKVLKPQLDIITKQQAKATTAEEKAQLSSLMMQVYQKNGTSMMPSIGCLTLLIQLPIFSGLYMGIQYSQEISSSHFFGFNLGKPNLIITIVASLLYVLQGYISLKNVTPEQRKTMQTTLIIGPAMTFFISLVSPAGLALYFLVGGIIIVIQQLIVTFVITPRIQRDIDEDLKEHPPVQVVTEDMFKTDTAKTTVDDLKPSDSNESDSDSDENSNRKRNTGKQKGHPKA